MGVKVVIGGSKKIGNSSPGQLCRWGANTRPMSEPASPSSPLVWLPGPCLACRRAGRTHQTRRHFGKNAGMKQGTRPPQHVKHFQQPLPNKNAFRASLQDAAHVTVHKTGQPPRGLPLGGAVAVVLARGEQPRHFVHLGETPLKATAQTFHVTVRLTEHLIQEHRSQGCRGHPLSVDGVKATGRTSDHDAASGPAAQTLVMPQPVFVARKPEMAESGSAWRIASYSSGDTRLLANSMKPPSSVGG